MSGYGADEPRPTAGRDPVVKFLIGCAAVAAVVVVVLIAFAVLLGWRLTRDEAPGRPPEAFLAGDEARYWSVTLRPDDAGLRALFARAEEINDATRRNLLRGTFLEALPIPHRRARLDEVAPLTLEFSQVMSGPPGTLQTSAGWAARGTFTHDVLRVRAAIKMMRWMIGRDPAKSQSMDVDGVPVTHVHDAQAEFALAAVGNRVIVASDAARMRDALRPGSGPPDPLKDLFARHDAIKLDGEDGWGFLSNVRAGDLSDAFTVREAAASFDVDEHDELLFRVVVADLDAPGEDRRFRGTLEDCSAVVAALLPPTSLEGMTIDGPGAQPSGPGAMTFSGRITGLSARLSEMPRRLGGFGWSTREHRTPSASPPPPSPPPPSGHRSGTPEGPSHAETPKPPR